MKSVSKTKNKIMNRLHKRRIDNTKKRSRVNLEIENIWSKAARECAKEQQNINDLLNGENVVKTYNTEDLPPNRMITFETDPNDVWEYSKTD